MLNNDCKCSPHYLLSFYPDRLDDIDTPWCGLHAKKTNTQLDIYDLTVPANLGEVPDLDDDDEYFPTPYGSESYPPDRDY